ncbi:MAG: class I SAM-dependent methyltransferase [Phycisphaerales bacterium]|nr:class I SAM-dependent methyltransferase [Phycisphaerales bacterium]
MSQLDLNGAYKARGEFDAGACAYGGAACMGGEAGRVPVFLRYPAGEDKDAERIGRVVARLGRMGWREAVDEEYADNESTRKYVTDASRTAFMDLLPISSESRVLEIGASLGQHTVTLARRAKSVHAIEVVRQQAEFCQERCRQEGLGNVSVACGGDDCELPYLDGTFDVVVLNLVLEWCGTRDAGSAVGAQKRMLREMARVLRPGGVLFLSTKNRFALGRLLGRPDEHAHGMRFGNTLPRWLMHLGLRLRGKRRPGGLLHSYGALRRMIEGSGLEVTGSFWAVPEMRYPDRFVPGDAASIRRARGDRGLVQGEFRSTRLIMPRVPAGLVKHVTPGLAFVASKPAGGNGPGGNRTRTVG